MLFTCFEVFFFGVVMLVDEALVKALGWWTIFVANILAATAMLGYFRTRHVGLGARARRAVDLRARDAPASRRVTDV